MIVRDYMTSDVVHVEIPGNRDDVLKILKRTGISGVPVIKSKKIVGIITRKDLLRKPEETQLGLLMTAKPITIDPDTDMVEAARLLVKKRIRRLPVVENNKLLGLLSVADVIHALATVKCREEIKDTYVSKSFALWEETPLPVVGRVMEISGVDAIPILDADNTLMGIISERDLIRSSSIEDSVGVSDFSNGTDDDEWTWESIRDNHMAVPLAMVNPTVWDASWLTSNGVTVKLPNVYGMSGSSSDSVVIPNFASSHLLTGNVVRILGESFFWMTLAPPI